VTAAATLLLVAAGGLVTSQAAGLAVPDWPNSFGTNMFLFPLSRMTGGIYYEHAHRLFGSLVGLCTLILALHLQCSRASRALKSLGWLALVAVAFQGMLGGLRVTGGFTTSLDSANLAPNATLAAVHGVFGQLFFAFMLVLTVIAGRDWRSGRTLPAGATAVMDRQLAPILVGLLIVQLTIGAALRHFGWGLHLHITIAVLIALLGGAVGARAFGLYKAHAVMRRHGRLLSWLLVVQILLGISALVTGGGSREIIALSTAGVLLTTAHQVTGALMLGVAAMHALWTRRLSPAA
jgi:cytochrome c oxidase assembly protein subunit 15